MSWIAYPAIVATIISVICLSYLALRKHVAKHPRTLSELAVDSVRSLTYFRLVLWLCGSLFAVTMYGYVIPNLKLAIPQTIAWSVTYLSEVLLACVPAVGKGRNVHLALATLMGLGMLSSAWVFVFSVTGNFAVIELVLASTMTVLVVGTVVDKKRYIFYELPFIFLAHISILTAVFSI